MLFTASALLCLAAAGVQAGDRPNRNRENWHFGPHKHPGWRGPSVYTPPGPKPTWPGHTQLPPYPYSEPTTFQSYPTPTGSPTVTASASTTGTGTGTSTAPAGTGPCATVSKLVASFSATNSDPSATPMVPAGVAYQCINSVPFNSSSAVELMDSIRPYIDWQTTTSYLKDPPADYANKIQPPYDFWANFERIYDAAAANSYENEYAFEFDLYRAFQMGHDGHFVYYPYAVTLIFNFGRPQGLVSLSPDGQSAPKIYLYSDVLASSMSNSTNGTFAPSDITQIDGQDSIEYLLNWSQYGSLQDRDALWNNVFVELAQIQLGPFGSGLGTFAGGGRGRYIYPGETTELTFANGTSMTLDNFARVLVPFDGISTGEQLYQEYFTLPPDEPQEVEELATMSTSSSSVAMSSSTSSSASSTVSAPGYPSPVYREMNNLNSGYFLEGEGYEDVAVLSVNSFVSSEEDEVPFQVVNTAFLNAAKAAGKTKLIVDVQANGGGTILQGYDLFKQLFPQILPYGATRFRAHEALDLIGQEVSWYSDQFPRSLDLNDTVLNIISSAYNYMTDVDVNYENFASWADKYGPQTFGPGPDNFTNIIRWNLSDVLTPLNSGGIEVSGYNNRSNITTQPFAAEDIVVVTDGYCASTCAIFSELMRQQGGVQFVMLGGRPTVDVVQAVGGVKGTNSFPWSYILDSVELPFVIQHYHDEAYYNDTALGNYSDLPLYRATNFVVNARDGYREGDESNTPLQFVYEPADCRIYYTPAMAVDQSAMWKSVADSAFNGVDRCVAGAGSLNGAENEKRSVKAPPKHLVPRGMDVKGHYAAFDSVWTGKGQATLGGDGYMPL